jgi:hypothetical protein
MPTGTGVWAQVVPDAIPYPGHGRANIDVASDRKGEAPETANGYRSLAGENEQQGVNSGPPLVLFFPGAGLQPGLCRVSSASGGGAPSPDLIVHSTIRAT